MNCENCGIPKGSYSHPGYMLKLAFSHERHIPGRMRHAKRTVWTCSPDCAVQTAFIAQFAAAKRVGKETVEWPMSLREYTARMNAAGKLAFLKGSTRDKTPPEVYAKPVVFEGLELNLEELYAGRLQEGFVTPPAKKQDGTVKSADHPGRPAVKEPQPATLRKRRQRVKTRIL
jgi:hypothetical protein